MKTVILALMILFMLGCGQQSGNNPATGNSPSRPIEPNGCALQLPSNASNTEVAIAFNYWRIKCNPSETNLNAELEKF